MGADRLRGLRGLSGAASCRPGRLRDAEPLALDRRGRPRCLGSVAVAVAGVAGFACLGGRRVARPADGRRPPRFRARRRRVHHRLADRLAELRSAALRPDRRSTWPRLAAAWFFGYALWLVGAVTPQAGRGRRSAAGRETFPSRPGRGAIPSPCSGMRPASRCWSSVVVDACPGDGGALTTRRRSAGRGGDAVTTSDRHGRAGTRRPCAARPEAGDRVDSLPTTLVHAPARVARAHRRALDARPRRDRASACPRRGSCPTRSSTPSSRRASPTASRPAVRGVSVFGWGVVYPTLIAPAWAMFDDPVSAVPRRARDQRARHVVAPRSPPISLRASSSRGATSVRRRADDGARPVDGVHGRRDDGERLLSRVPAGRCS